MQEQTIQPPIPDEHKESSLCFLKLGGSLITDKTQAHTPRLEVINRLANEIASAWWKRPNMRLVLGHGSGSFGHIPANLHGTRQGVHNSEQWLGFGQVWLEASSLNRLVMDALHAAGLPAVALPPSASVIARDAKVESWNLSPLQAALKANLLPVIFGDVIFDTVRGGTILSTEELFSHLAIALQPSSLLLAGLEPGVWVDFPACTRLVHEITPANVDEIAPALSGSTATDVTGGMENKVRTMLTLVEQVPGLEVVIFSGKKPGLLEQVLLGARFGTLIH